jgi:mannan endo-1,4-beta-mannosidase
VTIRNTAAAPTNGWNLQWSFANGQVISQLWHGIVAQDGARVQVRNESWNPVIAAGGSLNLGFSASHNGTNTAPTSFTLNGVACSITG